MRNILVVNVNWLGDVIFSAPVFKALKTHFPKATVTCLCVPRVKDVVESIYGIDKVIIYDEEGQHTSLWGKWKLIRELQNQEFDGAFLLHRSLTRALLLRCAGIPIRVGFNTKRRGFLLTHAYPEPGADLHRSEYYLRVIESFGIKAADRKSVLNVSDTDLRQVDSFLESQGISAREEVIVINPGGNWDLKRWPAQNFRELIMQLRKDSRAKIVISGAPKDVDLVKSIARGIDPAPIVLAGKTDFKSLMALMRRASLVISADSGPLHVANCVGTKTIGIFGPTRPEITGPRGDGIFKILQREVGCNQKACYHLKCPDNICMQAVSVHDVLKAFRQISHP